MNLLLSSGTTSASLCLNRKELNGKIHQKYLLFQEVLAHINFASALSAIYLIDDILNDKNRRRETGMNDLSVDLSEYIYIYTYSQRRKRDILSKTSDCLSSAIFHHLTIMCEILHIDIYLSFFLTTGKINIYMIIRKIFNQNKK